MLKLVFVLCVLCCCAMGQGFPDKRLPDSPSASKCYQSLFDETGKNVISTEVPCDSLPQWQNATPVVVNAGHSRLSAIGLEPRTRPLSWAEAAGSKTFWVTHAIGSAGIGVDEYLTFRGVSHGCLEKGQFGVGYHPTFGRIGTVDWSIWGGLSIVDFLLRKAGMPIAPYSTPLVLAAKHGLGAYAWTQTNCL